MAEGGRPGVSSPVTVGREPELAILRRAIEEVRAGRPRVVVVSGEAGIGKSRLVAEAASRAGDVRVARGTGLALASSIPYLPFAEMLRGLMRDLPETAAAAVLGPARRELAAILPELAAGPSGHRVVGRRGEASDDLDRLRMYEALLRVAEGITRLGTTLFVLEDLQWMDPASLQLLSFLAHNVRRGEALLVLTVRSGTLHGNPAILPFLADLSRGDNVERIELGPLDVEGTRQQVAAILGGQGSAASADRIQRLGDGNPLYTEELLAAARRDGDSGDGVSPKLRELLDTRLARLPADALIVLRVAAAAGRSTDEDLLGAACGMEPGRLEAAIRAALDEHVLVRTGPGSGAGYRFRHEIMRTMVESTLLPAEAVRVHRSFAQALASRPVERQDAAEVAYHWDAAQDASRALAAHVAAGSVAERGYAFGQAHQHYERALVLWDTVADAETVAGLPWHRVAECGAGSAAKSGDHDRAIELVRSILASEPDADAEWVELMRSTLRWYLWESGRLDEALAQARTSVQARRAQPDRRFANALAHMGGLLLYQGREAEAKRHASEALRVARQFQATEEEILARGVIGWCLVLEGQVDLGILSIRQALEATQALERSGDRGSDRDPFDDQRHHAGLVLAQTQLTAALEIAGRAEQAHAIALDGYAVTVARGVERTYGSVLQATAMRALYLLGRWDEAEAGIRAALDGGAIGTGRLGLLTVQALIAVGRGRQGDAEASLAESTDLIDGTTPQDARRWVAAASAELCLWQGRWTDGLRHIALVTETVGGGEDRGPTQPVMPDGSLPRLLSLAARASAELAVVERAGGSQATISRLVADRVRAGLRRIGRRSALAEAWRDDLRTATAELERGDPSTGARQVQRWTAAVEAANGYRPYSEAYARLRLAESLLGQRRRRNEAMTELNQAMALAEGLGARPMLDEIERLAGRAGLHAVRSSAGASIVSTGSVRPFGLTAREVEVLVLVADGLSNPEIADRLFISPKTASVHVSNIYGKLGVESRVAAATIAHSLGLTGGDPSTLAG